jgi:hypothetical protein
MTIATSDARSLFTKMLIAVYKERISPKAFFRSFFRVVESATKELSIEVQRGTEKIAVDVERGTEGNRNTFSRSTEKIFVPPYYREYFDKTELDLYDRLFGSTEIDAAVFSQFIDSVADKLRTLQDKIERAYEKQCADVFLLGIVSLKFGINIDFKRKAASLVDKGAGNYWATGTVNPYNDLEASGNFLRQVGKAEGGILNIVMGSTAFADFLNNPFVKDRQKITTIPLDAIAPPQKQSVGAVLHGEISINSYRGRIWTYPEFYDNSGGVSTPYMDPKKVVVLPENTNFVLGFAAVPQLIDEKNPTIKKGAFVIGDYKDERNHKHIQDIRSAGVAIPVAVDQIYTVKVVA